MDKSNMWGAISRLCADKATPEDVALINANLERQTTLKRGRPKKSEEIRKSEHINTRISKSIRLRIERSAKRNKCTLSQEIANRLDQSFRPVSENVIVHNYGPLEMCAVAVTREVFRALDFIGCDMLDDASDALACAEREINFLRERVCAAMHLGADG